MPFVHVELLEGKTLEQKREMAKGITDVIVKAGGVNPDSVYVIFKDLAKTELAKAGQLIADKQ
ncbi:4-oxalocrotonate tautomerase [Desulfofarcimen acetoxidans DSM 771]|jgi:4-oxalocrotonate tautomerase|uniref:4-oxalocrotonate tautomerase n=1 Tax=Desulfofarcimen acetoxidans (strain ATCC 49208 / DSM 771 / KCTC 5769 / VKM B-1644 / 5575) TaxID=485916 RepID=C8W674_DESAS|nr:2-hydroxymuconate tautomerase [Desulfofarcimen acetoxidans]ACV61529.1 4-oxalocrotonate tautomerase [Desulfofarcimen acetoxidans DSM 771]